MNDEKLEQLLRSLPAPELPEIWRAEILATARRKAASSPQHHSVWPTLLLYLRNTILRNPITTGAMTALWALILFLKINTPVDPSERMLLAHYDPNRPVYLVSKRDELLLAQLEFAEPEQGQPRRMP